MVIPVFILLKRSPKSPSICLACLSFIRDRSISNCSRCLMISFLSWKGKVSDRLSVTVFSFWRLSALTPNPAGRAPTCRDCAFAREFWLGWGVTAAYRHVDLGMGHSGHTLTHASHSTFHIQKLLGTGVYGSRDKEKGAEGAE